VGGVDEPTPSAVPTPLRAAAVIVLVEALALVAAAIVLIVKTIGGDPDDVWRALLGAALALAGAAALVAGARALLRLRPAARSPIVVLQLLALPVAYSMWFQAGVIAYGAPIMVAALVTLFLLFTPPVREALDRDLHR
jgi:hypothetical protein